MVQNGKVQMAQTSGRATTSLACSSDVQNGKSKQLNTQIDLLDRNVSQKKNPS